MVNLVTYAPMQLAHDALRQHLKQYYQEDQDRFDSSQDTGSGTLTVTLTPLGSLLTLLSCENFLDGSARLRLQSL